MRLFVIAAVVCCAFAAAAVTRAGSSPSSLSPGTALKTTIYQGVVSVSQDGSTLMELGNLGQDIAGTGDLYLRPNGLQESVGAQVTKNGANADLLVGSLCLYGTGSEVCQSGIPSGGSGDTFWKAVAQTASYTVLQPSNADTGVMIGTWNAPINGRALEVYANTTNAAVVLDGFLATKNVNWTDGSYRGGGNVVVNGAMTVSGVGNYGWLETYYQGLYSGTHIYPWSSAYQGVYSQLDADTLDGTTTVNFAHNTPLDFFWKKYVSGFDVTKTCSNAQFVPCTTNAQCVIPGFGSGTCQTHVDPHYNEAMCVHSTAPGPICAGGVNAGKACPNGDSDCPGGTCGALCQIAQATCPADPVSGFGHCSGNTNPCTQDSDCASPLPSANPTTCILGRVITQSGFPDPFCSGADEICANNCRTFNVACDGSSGGACASADTDSTRVKSSTGVVIYTAGSDCGWNGFSYGVSCDCRLTQPVPYGQAQPSTPGGDLCTDIFAY